MHNLDEKHPTRPGLQPSTSEFRITNGPNEQSRPAVYIICKQVRSSWSNIFGRGPKGSG